MMVVLINLRKMLISIKIEKLHRCMLEYFKSLQRYISNHSSNMYQFTPVALIFKYKYAIIKEIIEGVTYNYGKKIFIKNNR